MHIRRIYIKNLRTFSELDIRLSDGATAIIGENNTGKTNLIHGIRLALDANLPSFHRNLVEHDFHAGVDIANPQQVMVSLEFTNYSNNDNECALAGCWEIEPDVARLTYRFRPRVSVQEALVNGERENDLQLEDYHWQLTGGGGADPAEVEWSDEIGTSIRFSDLQSFQVVVLDALRNVEQDLRRSRTSPLDRILSTTGMPQEEKQEIVEILRQANDQISERGSLKEAGEAIHKAFNDTSGEAHSLDIKLGITDPSFASVARSLTLLLSNNNLSDFDPSRNGLGLNNLLYISMLVHYFEMRVADTNTAGQLLIVEEPEAHLHPQLQRTLYNVLREKGFQTIFTTHSTHISSLASLESYVVLTSVDGSSPKACSPISDADLSDDEGDDLERYLDATKSTLLFARRVILVEGPAELFLIPALVKSVLDIDLDERGISIVPIYGTHFDVYTKLFCSDGLPKRCAVITDGDLKPSDQFIEPEDEDPPAIDLDALESKHVKIFKCSTTFERAITGKATYDMIHTTIIDCGFPQTATEFKELMDIATDENATEEEAKAAGKELRDITLKAAKRKGKARFAQIASRHVNKAQKMPSYLKNAIDWICE